MATIKKFNCSNFSGLSVINEAPDGDLYSHGGSIIMTKPITSQYDLGFFTTRQFSTFPGLTVYIQTKCNFAGLTSGDGYNHMGFIELPELTGYGDGGIHTSYSLGRYGETYTEARNWFSLTPNGVYTYRQLTPNVFPIDVANIWTDKKFKVEVDGKLTVSIRPSPVGTIGNINPSVGPIFTDLPESGYKIGGTVGWHQGHFRFQCFLDHGGDTLSVNQIVITDNGVIS